MRNRPVFGAPADSSVTRAGTGAEGCDASASLPAAASAAGWLLSAVGAPTGGPDRPHAASATAAVTSQSILGCIADIPSRLARWWLVESLHVARERLDLVVAQQRCFVTHHLVQIEVGAPRARGVFAECTRDVGRVLPADARVSRQ